MTPPEPAPSTASRPAPAVMPFPLAGDQFADRALFLGARGRQIGVAHAIAVGCPSSTWSRMRRGHRPNLVICPPDPSRSLWAPVLGNLTSGYDKATRPRRRRQVMPSRVQQVPCSSCLRVRGHPMTHEQSQANMFGKPVPTDRMSATERAVTDVVPHSCRQLVARFHDQRASSRRQTCYPQTDPSTRKIERTGHGCRRAVRSVISTSPPVAFSLSRPMRILHAS